MFDNNYNYIFNVPLDFLKIALLFIGLKSFVCTQLYDIKYSNLIQLNYTQLYGIKYSYQVPLIHTQLYGIK